jgi:hypothetical protein
VEADRLTPGDLLRSLDGSTVTYTSEVVVPGAADMWDLTIAGDHDFYIHTVDATTVLVHNCPPTFDGMPEGMDDDEVARLASQHNGEADGFDVDRPSAEQNSAAMRGNTARLYGKGPAQYVQRVVNNRIVRVIFNPNTPYRPTSYFTSKWLE